MKRCVLLLLIFMLSGSAHAGNSISSSVRLDSKHNIVDGGFAFNDTTANLDMAIARYTPAGILDVTNFNSLGTQPGTVTLGEANSDVSIGTSADFVVNSIALDTDDSIVAVGFATFPPTETTAQTTLIAVARFTSKGLVDSTFNANSQWPGVPGLALISLNGIADQALSVSIDTMHRIVFTGSTNTDGFTSNLYVMRLLHDSTLDIEFNSDDIPGIFLLESLGDSEVGTALVLDAMNNIYVTGFTNFDTEIDMLTLKLTFDGILDDTFNFFGIALEDFGAVFNNFGGINSEANAIVLDQKGNVLIGGFNSDGLVANFALVRYTPEGELDDTFAPDSPTPGTLIFSISDNNDIITGLGIDSGGNIIASGITGTTTVFTFAIARFKNNGLLDTSFNNGTGVIVQDLSAYQTNDFIQENSVNGLNNAVVIGPLNSIIITGALIINNLSDFVTAKYTSAGILDPTFNTGNSLLNGIVTTHFGTAPPAAGNGVPLYVSSSTVGISPDIIEDIRTPQIPIIPQFAQTSFVSRSFQIQLSGQAQPFAFVRIFANNIEMGTTMTDQAGNWRISLPPLIDGQYRVYAVATDPISNLSIASRPILVTIDTRPLIPPAITGPADGQLVITDLLLQGRATPRAQVKIVVNGNHIANIVASRQGLWQLKLPLDDGMYAVYAQAIDQYGESEPSNMITVMVATGRTKPIILQPTQKVIKKPVITLSGRSRPQAQVRIVIDGKEVAMVNTNKEGAWAYTTNRLKDGIHRIQAVERTFYSDPLIVQIDTRPPVPPRIETAQDQKISGKGEPQGFVTLYLDNQKIGSTAVDQKGAWSFTLSRKLPAGKHSIKATVADAAGNVSAMVEKELRS